MGNEDVGRVGDADRGSREPDPQAVPAVPASIPSRKEKWAAFDAHYEEWKRRDDLAPAFVQSISEHSWSVQVLVHPDQPRRGWLYRLFNDPPIISMAEPFYNGWPGDRRGWLRFPNKEQARDFYQLDHGFIDFEEYRSRPHEPLTMVRIDLDERGNFRDPDRSPKGQDGEAGLIEDESR